MRLTDLAPQWIDVDGQHVGITFDCPACVARGVTSAHQQSVFWNTGDAQMSGTGFADLTVTSPTKHAYSLRINNGEIAFVP